VDRSDSHLDDDGEEEFMADIAGYEVSRVVASIVERRKQNSWTANGTATREILEIEIARNSVFD